LHFALIARQPRHATATGLDFIDDAPAAVVVTVVVLPLGVL
jgi:hypothetical protein